MRLIDADELEKNAFTADTRDYGCVDVVGVDCINKQPIIEVNKDNWIDIKKHTPENGYNLVYCLGGNLETTYFFNGISPDLCLRGYTVTHWMPLPKPPCDVKDKVERVSL